MATFAVGVSRRTWQDRSDPVTAGLKDRLPLLKGRCGSCRFKKICGGSSRARAEIATGDPWAADPGCYLSNEEIAGPPILQTKAATTTEKTS